jgi:hypothetical protein
LNLIDLSSTNLAFANGMKMSLPVLQCGNCEPLKAGFHATALGLCAIMGLYNAAAWLSRRQRHLAFNAVVYAALSCWEQRHLSHHMAELRKCQEPVEQPVVVAAEETTVVAELAA